MSDDVIDVTFDFHADSGGKDPDQWSETLRRYHRILWSKPLPDGTPFELVEDGGRGSHRLLHNSPAGNFRLTSDTITNRLLKRAGAVVATLPPEKLPPYRGYTIGSALLFPGVQRNGHTINQARGMRLAISDRIDLTLECIRRHYAGGESPLADRLAAYDDFFALFRDFDGYVDFWLLHDLVDNGRPVMWLPFDGPLFAGFHRSAVPADAAAYLEYSTARETFISARNARIDRLYGGGHSLS